MLQQLNERFKGVVAWVIVILIALTFTMFGVDYYLQSRQGSDNALEIDGISITKRAYELQYRRARQQIDPATISKAQDDRLQEQVTQDLISKQVALIAAKDNGFLIDTQQANSAILAIPQFQQDGKFSATRYQQALSGAMFTPESFQTEVSQGMLFNQQRFAFMGTAFALPGEINRFIQLYFQKRDYQYVMIPYAQFEKQQTVSNQETEQYYHANPSEFLTPEKVSVQYIELSLAKERKKQSEKISSSQVKAYYDENKANYMQPARWQVSRILITADANNQAKQAQKANDIAKQVQTKPDEFARLRKQYTADKLSLSQTPTYSWITAGQDELSASLLHFKQVNEVTGALKTRYGYEILQVKKYQPASVKPFSEVRETIRQQMTGSLAEKVFNRKLETLIDLTFQTPDSLDSAAQAVSEPIENTSFFSRQNGGESLSKDPKFIQAAFSHEVLDLENNSEQVQIDGDTVVFLRLKAHQPAKEKPLKTVSAQIKQHLQLSKARTHIDKLGREFVEGTLTSDQLSKQLGQETLAWTNKAAMGRASTSVAPEINKLAFNIQAAGHLSGKALNSKGFLLVKLNQIHPGKQKTIDAEQRKALKQQLESTKGMMAYELYVNGLIKQAHIENHLSRG